MDATQEDLRAQWANGTQDFAERFRHFRCATPWFHTIWYDAYDDPSIHQLYVQGPREHAKSSTVWTYALRRLCENHQLRIGIISGTDDLAIKFLNEIKFELEANEELKRLYGGPFVGDVWTKHELVLRDARVGPNAISGKDVSVFAIGRGGQISSRHCDLLIADDVESADTVKTENVRQGTAEWWAREVGPVLSPGGKFIVVGCLAEGTPVLMSDGTWRSIEQVTVGEQVWSADETGWSGIRTVEAVIDQGEAETLRVAVGQHTQGRGRTAIEATPNHPFLVARGDSLAWVRADELVVGDLIAETKETPGQSQFEWVDEEFCWLLGYLFGDGWVTSNRNFIACALGTDEAMNERVMTALKEWLPTVNFVRTPFGYIRAGVPHGSSYTGASRLIARALGEYGLGDKAAGKRIPEWIFRSPPEQRRAFLRGFADADGCQLRAQRLRDASAIEIANQGLVEDLRHLALTCGVRPGMITSRIRTIKAPHSRDFLEATSWRISLNFAWTGTMERDPKGAGGGRAYVQSVAAAKLLGPNFRFVPVVAVEPAGRRHVWDLTVEGTPAFVADGLVVHNTRKSHVDLYSRLIGDPTWTTISDAASVWKEDGEPIWPEMWDKAALLVRKATLDKSDVLAWSQEYLNHPMPHETQMFHPESWPQYADEPHSMAAREDMSVLQYWDLAISEKTTADFTVGICVAVDQDNKMYLLEVRRGHWDFNRTLQEIGSLGASYPKVLRVGIEKVAYQAAAVQEATRRTMLPIVPIEPDKDKVTRARLVEARANVSMVFRPVASEWWADFATETSFFPDVGTHDDQVDALSGVALMAGWNADSIAYAYNVWTCLGCGHMFMWDAGRACPKCGVKAPPTFANPDMAAYGGLLEDMPKDETESQMRSENATVMAPPSAVVAPGPATAPPAAKVAGQPTYEVEVELGDPQYSVSLRHAVEQMGDEVEEREGRYFVATRRPGPIRTALAQLPYVQSVI